MKFKMICLSLILPMVMVMFSGCKKTTPSTTNEPAKPDKPLEMTVRMFYHGEIDQTMAKNSIDFNNNKIANFHRQHSGVNVTFQPALADGTQETQKKAMILASNDVPDLMDVSRDEYFKYALQGVLAETDSYLKTMPDYVKLAGDVVEALRYKGKLYGFASVLEEGDLNRTTGGGIMVRKDIFDSLGIAVPKTIDDYYNMWKTVKEKTQYIPLTAAGDNFSAIKAAFRVALDYKMNGDKLEYIWTQPEYKDYLAFMNKLYKEGLLDKEYITTNGTALTEKFMGDKAFSSNQGWAYAVVNVRDIGKKINNAKVAFLPQPSGPNGNKALLNNNWPVQRIWVIPAGAKNKEAAAKFMNYMSTPESKMVQDYGIEGEDYTKGSDGKPVTTTEKQMNVTWKICYEVMATPASFKVRLVTKGYDWAYNQALEAQKGADMTTNILSMLPTNPEFQKLEQRLALKTFISEQVTKFIIGERPIAEFDKFVQELKGKGLDEQTQALNKWYSENKK